MNVTKFRILQITVVTHNAYAIFKSQDGTYFREPIPAWGIWTQWEVDNDDRRVGPIERCAGPLVIHTDLNELVPAVSHGECFVGIRYGHWAVISGEVHTKNGDQFDEPSPVKTVTP